MNEREHLARIENSRRYRAEHKPEIKKARYMKGQEIQSDPDHPMHGTVSGYYYGCRCKECKMAQSFYFRELSRKRLKEMQEDPDHPQHGTCTGYGYGCRCEACRRAKRNYERKWKREHRKQS